MKKVFYAFGAVLLVASIGFIDILSESNTSHFSSQKIRELKRGEYQVTDDGKIKVGDKVYDMPDRYKEDSELIIYNGKVEIKLKFSIPKRPGITHEERKGADKEVISIPDREKERIARLEKQRMPGPATPEGDYSVQKPKSPKGFFKRSKANKRNNPSTASSVPKIRVNDPR